MAPGHATSTTPNHTTTTAATTSAFRSRPSTYGSPPITHAPVPRPDSLIIPGVGTPVRMHTTLANSLLAEKSHLQSRAVGDEKMSGGGINGGGGHSRSASVQSSSSMVLQTPGKRRHQPLSRHHHQGGSPTLQPSISIASLIHPSSPTPTQAHPLATVVSSSTSTPNMTASSIPSPNLSASFPESGLAAEPISALQLSVDAAGEEARRKRPIDAWFATGAIIADAEEMDGVLSVAQPTKRQGQSALERWSRFTLGSKRPRTSDDDDLEVTAPESADRLEDPRPGKKALFVGSGRYNT
ncbi:hypothetical protein CPB86DRAFT_45944 [Serendipita vermifera]|nr:hypothetical protein CPB86DRAFT_45944 [Serendipita vermifera]